MNRFASPRPYTDIFNQKFPYYLSIGMTEEQYWDRDCCLVKFYRDSPILHAFAKKGTKAQPYVEEAYPISKKTMEDAKTKKEKAKSQKGMRYMQAYMVANNKRFDERK